MDAAERDSIIQLYFEMGLKYADITRALAVYHQIIITERHLKRILKKLGLFRRKEYSNVVDVISFVEQQLQESGKLHGYRWMTQKCKVNGLKCTQEEIRIIIRVLDPEGPHQRKGRRLLRRSYISKGPNFIWHLDSYDKLKRFGFCINGCVDGYSRLVVWLNCYITSSDPRVIASYFMESVSSLEGCPHVVRGDLGTENVLVKQLQMFLRRNGDDNRAGELSYLGGPSTANQRIEYFWNFLRRECTDYWICLFREVEADGNFDGSFLDVSLMQYCFMHLVHVGIYIQMQSSPVFFTHFQNMLKHVTPSVWVFFVLHVFDLSNMGHAYLCLTFTVY